MCLQEGDFDEDDEEAEKKVDDGTCRAKCHRESLSVVHHSKLWRIILLALLQSSMSVAFTSKSPPMYTLTRLPAQDVVASWLAIC